MSHPLRRLSKSNELRLFAIKVGMVATIVALLASYLFFSISNSALAEFDQQSVTDTHTVSPTVSPTATDGTPVNGTLTATVDLTITATPSPTITTLTTNPTPTLTPTFGVVFTLTPTNTSNALLTATVTELLPTPTSTPTYLPLPTVTMIYPKVTVTPYLMMAYRSANTIQKQRMPFVVSLLVRFWPLGLILLVWGVLTVWFVIVQHKIG